MNRCSWWRPLGCGVVLAAVCTVATASVAADKTKTEATHKQVRMIKPTHEGKPIKLHTFCLDRQGNILACCGGNSQEFKQTENGFEAVAIKQAKMIQVLSPEGELLKSYPVEFTPTAISLGPDGSIVVAGEGHVAMLDSNGNVVRQASTPNVADLEELRKQVELEAKQQAESMLKVYTEQLERIDKQIAKITETPEDKRNDRQQARLKSYEQQKELFQQQLDQMKNTTEQMFGVDAMMSRKLAVTALSVTETDVFFSCAAMKGHGYDIWRVDHKFEYAKQVLKGIGGCCGQMDIKADGDKLLVAENTKFRVGIYDRDGNRQNAFGKRDRKSVEAGFGSCCNPMNVCCTSNGDILTAESSIGNIKRFGADGEFKGFVGKAKIGGGCKHVALAVDEKRDHFYMMYQDKSSICVLVPVSEAPEFTAEELAAKEAREGLGQRLVGKWNLPKAERKAATINNPFSSLPESIESKADGAMVQKGGFTAGDEVTWEAVRQDNQTLMISVLMDGVEFNSMKIEFQSDDKAKVSMIFNDQVMATDTYSRAR